MIAYYTVIDQHSDNYILLRFDTLSKLFCLIMGQFTSLFSSVLTSISRVHAVLKITDAGVVIDVETARHSAYHQVWEEKLLNKNVRDFFVLPSGKSIEELSAHINDNDLNLNVSDLFNPNKRYVMPM